MYRVDHRDRVVPLTDVPQSSIGAPLPIVLASEYATLLAYYTESSHPSWNGTNPRCVSAATTEDPVAIVDFVGTTAHYFGPPNDEAFSGHPLASRGLSPCGAFEVLDSSWIRLLIEMNSVHSHHSPKLFEYLRHFIFTFHDDTFECVAGDFGFTITKGPLSRAVSEIHQRLFV
jgi:hypothetical protein